MDDLADMMEDMNEVNEILGRSYTVGDEIDEDDLDAELAALDDELEGLDEIEEEALESHVPSEGRTTRSAEESGRVSLPKQPTSAINASATDVDEFGLPRSSAPLQAEVKL